MRLLGLKKGSRGRDVEILQALLNCHKPSSETLEIINVVIDGRFGSETELALVNFQFCNNLTASGIVDFDTNHVLLTLHFMDEKLFDEIMEEKRNDGIKSQYIIPTLNLGDKHIVGVTYMQAQLKFLYPSRYLEIDGEFCGLTEGRLKYFQRENNIEDHGKLDSRTNQALHLAVIKKRGQPLFRKIYTSMPCIPQSTSNSCFAACTAMLTKSTESEVLAKLPADLGNENTGLMVGLYYVQPVFEWMGENVFKLKENERGHKIPGQVEKEFAKIYGLDYHHYHPPSIKTPGELCRLIRKSPIMFAERLASAPDVSFDEANKINFTSTNSKGHYRVIAGVISDENNVGEGTYLIIYDPAPVGEGSIYIRPFSDFFGPDNRTQGLLTLQNPY